MKRNGRGLRACMALLLSFALCVPGVAYTGTVQTVDAAVTSGTTADGLSYTIDAENNCVTITGYTGSATELTIPSEIDGYPVTKIGAYAFEFSNVKTVTLEDGIQEIGTWAFLSASLESIVIPKSVTKIGMDAIGYIFVSKADDPKKASNPPTIYCYKKSAAHTYAVKNDIPYVLFDPDSQETLSDSNVTLHRNKYSYTGYALTPNVTVKDAAGNILTEGTDYTVTYANYIEVGTATITITGTGDYTGTVTKTFQIVEAPTTAPTTAPTAAPTAAVLYGDADETGKIDASDALIVLRAVVKLTDLSDAQTKAADVNGDGKIAASDALLILQKVVKLIDTFPVETAQSEDVLANLASLEDVRASLVKDVESLVTLGKYKGVDVTITAATVSDKDVEKQITWNLENAGSYEQITEGTVADGTLVNISYVGTIEGEVFSGGSAENVNLRIGSDSYIDGFEDGLIGAGAGDTLVLCLTIPDNYSNAELAGHDAVFTVTINYICGDFVAATLSDDWVAEQAIDGVSTVDAYRAYVRSELEEEAAEEDEHAAYEALMEKIIASSTINGYSEDLDKEEIMEEEITTLEEYAEYYGMTTDELTREAMGMTYDEYLEQCSQDIDDYFNRIMIYRAVMAAENLQVTEAEYEEAVLKYAANYADYGCDSAAAFVAENSEDICIGLLNTAAENFLLDNANITKN